MTVYNPNDAITTLAFSGGNLTVGGGTTATNNWSGCRSDFAVPAGKYYIEHAITGNSTTGGSNGSIAVGAATISSSISGVPGSGTGGQFYFPWSGLTENAGSTG